MFKSFLNFENMVTPNIIKFIYWIGIIAVIISGLGVIFTASQFGGYFSGVLSGIATILFGVIGVRISCELIILSFNIYEKLKEIAKNTAK